MISTASRPKIPPPSPDGAGEESPSSRWRLGYRPALDGLRGLAILFVLLSHASVPPFYGGGLTGVTIFFVLSGYLITSLLLQEYRTSGSRISLWSFYERRARRLLPALCAVIVVVSSAAVVTGSGLDALTDALAALFYLGNWATIPEAGLGLGLLSHTWSLAVEEHFYILWPIVLVAALPRMGRRGAVSLLVAAILISVSARILLVTGGASDARVAFGSDTRADALLVGCLVAFVPIRRVPVVPAVLGLVLMALFMRYDAGGLTFGLCVVSLLSAITVVGAADGTGWLGWRPLARLGRISYGVYLWHYPLMFGLAPALGLEGLEWAFILVAASVAIGEASYRWIETPFLARSTKNSSEVLLVRERSATPSK